MNSFTGILKVSNRRVSSKSIKETWEDTITTENHVDIHKKNLVSSLPIG